VAGQRIFISYSRSDGAFVDRLAEDLRNHGLATWRDTNEIAPGDNWEKAIEEGLRSAPVLLYVSSERGVQSEWMKTEALAVIGRETRVIPLVIDDVGADRLPLFLKALQWIDFQSDYQSALQALLKILRPFAAEQPTPKQTRKNKGYVFLSYAEADATFVDELKSFLAEKGYAYWDYRESDRDYHNDLYLELEGVISEASATLSCVSPDWKQSRVAVKEYHFSVEVGIPVFLLRVRNPGPTLVIAGIPYIDFASNRSSGFDRLDKELARKGL